MKVFQIYGRNGCHADSQTEKQLNEQKLLFVYEKIQVNKMTFIQENFSIFYSRDLI